MKSGPETHHAPITSADPNTPITPAGPNTPITPADIGRTPTVAANLYAMGEKSPIEASNSGEHQRDEGFASRHSGPSEDPTARSLAGQGLLRHEDSSFFSFQCSCRCSKSVLSNAFHGFNFSYSTLVSVIFAFFALSHANGSVPLEIIYPICSFVLNVALAIKFGKKTKNIMTNPPNGGGFSFWMCFVGALLISNLTVASGFAIALDTLKNWPGLLKWMGVFLFSVNTLTTRLVATALVLFDLVNMCREKYLQLRYGPYLDFMKILDRYYNDLKSVDFSGCRSDKDFVLKIFSELNRKQLFEEKEKSSVASYAKFGASLISVGLSTGLWGLWLKLGESGFNDLEKHITSGGDAGESHHWGSNVWLTTMSSVTNIFFYGRSSWKLPEAIHKFYAAVVSSINDAKQKEVASGVAGSSRFLALLSCSPALSAIVFILVIEGAGFASGAGFGQEQQRVDPPLVVSVNGTNITEPYGNYLSVAKILLLDKNNGLGPLYEPVFATLFKLWASWLAMVVSGNVNACASFLLFVDLLAFSKNRGSFIEALKMCFLSDAEGSDVNQLNQSEESGDVPNAIVATSIADHEEDARYHQVDNRESRSEEGVLISSEEANELLAFKERYEQLCKDRSFNQLSFSEKWLKEQNKSWRDTGGQSCCHFPFWDSNNESEASTTHLLENNQQRAYL